MSKNLPTRVWFMNQGCKQVPLEYTQGIVRWAHPDGYFLNAQGQKVKENFCASWLALQQNPAKLSGKEYPHLREGAKKCHNPMALAFYGKRPTYTDKNGKPYVGICHHLIPDPLDYKPANLLCWLTRAEHAEADRRQRALREVVPDGDLHLFTYERLRELQDPRTMSREQFETELAALAQQGFYRDNLTFDQRMDRDMSHHCEG